MFVGRYVPKTNNFGKVIICFQFHFNWVERGGKMVTYTSIHQCIPTDKMKNRSFWTLDETPSNFWQNRQVLKFNLNEY